MRVVGHGSGAEDNGSAGEGDECLVKDSIVIAYERFRMAGTDRTVMERTGVDWKCFVRQERTGEDRIATAGMPGTARYRSWPTSWIRGTVVESQRRLASQSTPLAAQVRI